MTTTNETKIAEALGWDARNVGARLGALGLLDVCGRCGGSGRHSYNQIDGDRCFGCRGGGKCLPKHSAALIREAKARVAAGGLDAYLARCAAVAASKRELPALVARAKAAYSVIGAAYDAAYKASTLGGRDGAPRAAVWHAQTMANSLFFDAPQSVSRVEHEAMRGKLAADVAAARILEALEYLETLRDAWLAFTP